MVYRRGKKENNQAGNFFKQRWKTMWKKKNFSGEGSPPTCWESGKRHRKKAKGHNGYI